MRYVPAFDSLRAISVLFVIFFHLHGGLFAGGWIGVDIFFVLSGYLITSILQNELEKTGSINLRQFYLFRILRLAPALLFLLLVISIATPIFPMSAYENLRSVALALTYTSNWNLAYGWWQPGVLGHTWSLSIEEQFYFLWPLLIFALPKKRILHAAIFLFIATVLWRFYLSAYGANWQRGQFGSDTRSSGILVGCIIAAFPKTYLQVLAGKLWAVPVLGLLALAFGYRTYNPVGVTLGAVLAALLAAWLVVAILNNATFEKALAQRQLIYLGQISYGIYLWHVPIVNLVEWKILPMPANKIAIDAFVLITSVAMAAFSNRYIEQYFLRIKEKIKNKSGVAITSKPAL